MFRLTHLANSPGNGHKIIKHILGGNIARIDRIRTCHTLERVIWGGIAISGAVVSSLAALEVEERGWKRSLSGRVVRGRGVG